MEEKEITEDEVTNTLLVYTIYSCLYCNDTICTEIRFLDNDIKTRDKETRKIYGALKKRANAYLDHIVEVIGDKVEYYGDYCGYVDELSEEKINALKTQIKALIEQNVKQDADFCAKIESLNVMTNAIVGITEKIVEKNEKQDSKARVLYSLCLREIQKICNNLTHWCKVYNKEYGKTEIAKDENVKACATALAETLIDHQLFADAYVYARNLAAENNSNGKQ